MNLLTQENLRTILSASFASLGFILVLIALINTTIKFILNNFTKNKINSNKKSFIIPLIGVSFIVALAIISDNPFIYALSIIIIATLITELEFLEKLMALLWNRPAYWQYQELLVAAKLPQQTTVGSSKDKKQLEGLDKKLEKEDEKTEKQINPNDLLLLEFHSERVYRLIFGTQLGILQLLNMQELNGIAKFALGEIYKQNPISATYPFESYIGFLETNQLIKFNLLTNSYYITPFGKFFLGYLERNQIPPIRPN